MELRAARQALLRNAIEAAACGWPVFLLGRTKRPIANCDPCRHAGPGHDREACPCLSCHGFYAATRDPDRIVAMLDRHPDGLLAIRTGAASGLVVIDIDPHHDGGASLVRLVRAGLAPLTARVLTGSGGLHLYYAHPGTPILNSQSVLGPGVDVRGDGGYVVAPPSVHPRTGHPYRWIDDRPPVEMPPALIAACRPAPPPTTSTTARATPTLTGGGGISSPAALLAAHLNAVHRAGPGRRRTTLYGAARGVARMVAAGAITHTDAIDALTQAGRAVKQPDRDIRAAITGGFRAESVATEGNPA